MATVRDPEAAVPPALRDAVMAWYAATGRRLAFRATADPYAVLVSELMAQQTQAARAADSWTAFIACFPTVLALAEAPLADVLRAWAGLGYNRRALALHRAAQAIVAEHGGAVPASVIALERLPGVGPYTARAVAAIAFGLPVGAVDTNVRRVLGRVAAGGPEAFTTRELQALADAVVPVGRAGAWTHALMDVGARLCRPVAPRCADCPASAWCRYAAGERASGATHVASRSRRPTPRFDTTNRWLRGRILERARDADDGAWVAYAEPMGSHDAHAVREALTAMAAEGLLELRRHGSGPEARLPGHGAHNPPVDVSLERFVEAQRGVYDGVLAELRSGRKTGHWIWFIFPQVAGLGRSEMSRHYAISSLDEARAYLAHPVLGARLRECASILLAAEGRTAEQIFGGLDALKVRSCMTLFHRAAPDEAVFEEVLERIHGGVADPATDRLIS